MNWPQVELSKIAEINPRYRVANDVDLEQLVSFVPMAAVSETTCRIEDEQERPLGEVRKGFTSFKNDDVIVAKITPCFENGKVALVAIKHQLGFGSTEFHVFRSDKNQLFPGYLYHFVRQEELRFIGEKRMTGSAGQKRVPKVFWERLPIPLPPLPEQQRIAAILDKADALRAKRRAALAKLDTLLQATFLDMFGDPDSGFPKEKVETLIEEGKGKIRTGPFGSQLLHSEFIDDADGVMVLGIDNAVQNHFVYTNNRYITHEKYKQLLRYTVRPDDVLITIMGTCGRCSIVPEDIPLAINTKHLCCITLDPDKCLPVYLKYAFLLHPYVLEQLGVSERGAVMPGLNMGIIKNLSIPLPPIDAQMKFAQFAVKQKEQNKFLSKSSEELDNLFYAVQQRAFKGELPMPRGVQ